MSPFVFLLSIRPLQKVPVYGNYKQLYISTCSRSTTQNRGTNPAEMHDICNGIKKNIPNHRQLIPHHLVQDLQCHHCQPLHCVGHGPRQETLLVVCLINVYNSVNLFMHSAYNNNMRPRLKTCLTSKQFLEKWDNLSRMNIWCGSVKVLLIHL